MTCWTRLFRKRLLPLLLAAVMLTGMLPRLTVVAQAEEQGRKIDLTESSVAPASALFPFRHRKLCTPFTTHEPCRHPTRQEKTL